MSVEVVMPQMGESITEGTVSKWLKQVGERIEKDEAILEISTDKVDAEVPSPGAGILLEIRHQEGETVEVGTVVAIVGEEGSSAAVAAAPAVAEVEMTTASEPEPEAIPAEPVAAAPAVTEAPVESTAPPTTASATAAEVVMPQMGESITEGTVSKWLKAVGDKIEKDEALLEISTDKVDAEVPSPAAGTLLAINVQEGETVEVGSVLALVGAEGGAPVTSPKSEAASAAPTPTPEPVAPPVAAPAVQARAASASVNGNATLDELRRTKSSPLVRNIAKEHGIDITRIPGSGISGRVTKDDIMSFLETGAAL
ncbi:MAG: biotin/lipoyl-containing protein, partial [Pyrinomonadaceae bacterium]